MSILIRGQLTPLGRQPDGDSIRFRADRPEFQWAMLKRSGGAGGRGKGPMRGCRFRWVLQAEHLEFQGLDIGWRTVSDTLRSR